MHHGPTDSGIFAVREMVLQEDVYKCSFRVLCGLRVMPSSGAALAGGWASLKSYPRSKDDRF